MSIRALKYTIAVFVFTLALFALPGAAHAQFVDYPLPDPPNASGSITPGDEPLLFMGNYCGAFAGASLHSDASQSFAVDVIGEPVAAYFFWSGRGPTSASPDTSITIAGNDGVAQAVTADAALDAHSNSNFSWMTQAYDAVAGGFPAITTGTNTFTVSGLDFNEPHGAGVMVISEDVENCPFQVIGLFYGDDVFYHGWAPPSGPDSAITCIDFPAPPEEVEIDIQMFVGGVENDVRANAIWFETGSGPKPADLVGDIGITDFITMPLRGLSGVEFDNYDTVIQDPDENIIAEPGDTWACVQIESPECAVTGPGCDEADPRFADVPGIEQGVSGAWINLAMRIPLFDINITPDGINPVGLEHTFDITVDSSFGITSAEAITITPFVDPVPESMVDNCDTPVLTEKTASCTLTINSSVPGTFTATAVAEFEFADGQIARAETNGVGDSSGPAVKTYLLAAIDIEKQTNGEDADTPTGPMLEIGDPVAWTYIVENTGEYDLDDVTVTDDNGTPDDTSDDYTCDIGFMVVGAIDSTTCEQTGIAVAGQYANMAKVIGTPVENNEPTGAPPVEDEDPSHYVAGAPDIVIEKATNGEDADTPTGPHIAVGQPVNWTYVVTNTGNVALANVTVTDDKGVTVTCPKDTLAVDESMTCTANGIAVSGQYANVGSVTGETSTGTQVDDSDPSHYFGADPEIVIEKATNGEDADTPTGPYIDVGQPVIWSYAVTNTGSVDLANVTVTDDKGESVTCPKDTLVVGESMVCSANATAVAGQYANVGSVTGETSGGIQVDDSDPSHYFGSDPNIVIEKATNGEDADNPPGPEIPEGNPITWTYAVTNTGNVALTNIQVGDDQGVVVICPKSDLEPEESMTCTGTGFAGQGQYANMGTVVGTSPSGRVVEDEDPSHYNNQYTGIDDEDEPDHNTTMKLFMPMSPTR